MIDFIYIQQCVEYVNYKKIQKTPLSLKSVITLPTGEGFLLDKFNV